MDQFKHYTNARKHHESRYVTAWMVYFKQANQAQGSYCRMRVTQGTSRVRDQLIIFIFRETWIWEITHILGDLWPECFVWSVKNLNY